MKEENTPSKNSRGGAIAWMATSRVAANLLMLILLVGGGLFCLQVKQEVFPEFTLDLIQISIPYPGASPEEVEKSIIVAVEESIQGLDGVKEVTSNALEGIGLVTIELFANVNPDKLLQDVKNAVDRIQSIPDEAERPVVKLLAAKRQVISLMVYGDQDRFVLRGLAEKIRDDLVEMDGITTVELASVPPYEIRVEVPQENLRAYNFTLDTLAKRIKESALDLPAGGIKSKQGEILLRTKERRDYASEFESIPVVTRKDGTRVLLGEIAEIKEAFEDTDEEASFNGKPAVKINVFRVGDQTPLDISERVREYGEQFTLSLPDGVDIDFWDDRSEIYGDRIQLLVKNALMGLVLVLVFLGLFLEPRLAFWVTIGIPVSIIGSFLFIPLTGASINMVSLFAFIVTLGIIVDDAVVVGENIYQKREAGMPYLQAAIEGAKEISAPITFAVLTNIVAFFPLLFVPGSTGKIFFQIPAITMSVFLVSLIESLFVLPAHLSHRHKKNAFWDTIAKPSLFFDKILDRFIHNIYMKQLDLALTFRYLTGCLGVALLVLSVGIALGGYLEFSYLPRVVAELVTVQAQLPFGTSIEKTREIEKILLNGLQSILDENEKELSRGVYTQIGKKIADRGLRAPGTSASGGHIVGIQAFLYTYDKTGISGQDFASMWREKVGDIPGLESLIYQAVYATTGGDPVDIQLSHRSIVTLESAASELAERLKQYNGVADIDNGVTPGKIQMSFKVRPEARNLGLTSQEVARQVRSSFYGAEAIRQQRGRNELKVMVRLPEKDRTQMRTVEELLIRTPEGGEIPLYEAVDVNPGRSYTDIQRADGRRVLHVTADVDENIANANKILDDVKVLVIPELVEKYPGLTYSFEGQQKAQTESLDAMKIGFVFSLVAIFALLAIPFKSYSQPLIVMVSIPFGVIGAVIGHMLLGYELSIISMFGIIALSGVVVNDSLVLVVTANRKVEEGESYLEAIRYAGKLRFRPILLTSLTTFFGLAPMMFETSIQARFLIPMAISLGFGILFATFIILLLVPAAYLIIEDLKYLISKESS